MSFGVLSQGDIFDSIRATPRDSISFLSLLGIEILMEKYPTTVSLSGYPNVAIPCSVFLAN